MQWEGTSTSSPRAAASGKSLGQYRVNSMWLSEVRQTTALSGISGLQGYSEAHGEDLRSRSHFALTARSML